VTPQRVAILRSIMALNNHPTAENIIEAIKKKHPHIAVGTVYKVLDSLVENGLVQKVKTRHGVMRFDPLVSTHHHLYCEETDRIEDYEDEDLDKLIRDHFRKKGIKNFKVKDFKLEITGLFK
jgi:Fur family peroxide stress response transcriptional regulator